MPKRLSKTSYISPAAWLSDPSLTYNRDLKSPLPWVSVVIPSYNQGKYIETTLKSIIFQKYPKIEIILIDNNSIDSTIAVIANYREYLDIVIVESDDGQADALSKGFSLSKGAFLCWLNSDDFFTSPDVINLSVNELSMNSYAELIVSNCCLVSQQGCFVKLLRHPPACLRNPLLLSPFLYLPQQATFFTRNLYLVVGGINKNLHYKMDRDLYIRFMKATRTHYTDFVFGAFRTHPHAKSTPKHLPQAMLESIQLANSYLATPFKYVYIAQLYLYAYASRFLSSLASK